MSSNSRALEASRGPYIAFCRTGSVACIHEINLSPLLAYLASAAISVSSKPNPILTNFVPFLYQYLNFGQLKSKSKNYHLLKSNKVRFFLAKRLIFQRWVEVDWVAISSCPLPQNGSWLTCEARVTFYQNEIGKILNASFLLVRIRTEIFENPHGVSPCVF